MAAFSADLRERVYQAWRGGEGSSRRIAERFGVSDSFVRKLAVLDREHGSIAARPRTRGRKPKLSECQRDRLIELAGQQPDLTCHELKTRLRLRCCDTTVWRELKRAGFSFKRSLSKLASNSETTCERDASIGVVA